MSGDELTLTVDDYEDVTWMFQSLGMLTMELLMSGNRDPAKRLSEIQRRLLEENVELIRTAFLEDLSEDYLAIPKVSDEFLDILDLVVVNGKIRDKRKTIIFEDE